MRSGIVIIIMHKLENFLKWYASKGKASQSRRIFFGEKQTSWYWLVQDGSISFMHYDLVSVNDVRTEEQCNRVVAFWCIRVHLFLQYVTTKQQTFAECHKIKLRAAETMACLLDCCSTEKLADIVMFIVHLHQQWQLVFGNRHKYRSINKSTARVCDAV